MDRTLTLTTRFPVTPWNVVGAEDLSLTTTSRVWTASGITPTVVLTVHGMPEDDYAVVTSCALNPVATVIQRENYTPLLRAPLEGGVARLLAPSPVAHEPIIHDLPPHTAAVENDLGFLMQVLAETLVESGRTDLARILPWLDNEEVESSGSHDSITPPPVEVARVLSTAFQLLNMVEEIAASRARHELETQEGSLTEKGLWGERLSRLKRAGLSGEDIASRIGNIRVEPVLTAHPTEAKRAGILIQHREIYRLLKKLDNPAFPREAVREDLKTALDRLLRTCETNAEKPTVTDEHELFLDYLRHSFPRALTGVDARFRTAWSESGFDPSLIEDPKILPGVSFATWIKGDRDGHDKVKSADTAAALKDLRHAALDLHLENLERMAAKLTLSSRLQPAPQRLREALANYERDGADKGIVIGYPDEPWRRYALFCLERIKATRQDDVPAGWAYAQAEDFIADLQLLRDSLIEIGAHRIASADVAPVERHARVFKFHLANLDIRQNSGYHDKALGQIFAARGLTDAAGFASWDEERRGEFLSQLLASPEPLLPDRPLDAERDEEAVEMLALYRVLARHINEHGSEGLGALIVSMTRGASDLLSVYVLARAAGLLKREGDVWICPLPVVALFETIADLDHSPEILQRFLSHTITRSSLPAWGRLQVMLGYSDSTKDGGIFSSQWAVRKAQTRLAVLALHHGISLRIFHGRGGTVSRGAGPTHRFLEALPPGSFSGDWRMTEQGESIAQKYGNPETAVFNLEALLAGTAGSALIPPSPETLTPDDIELIDGIAEASRQAYANLVSHGDFMTYFSAATPIDAIEETKIGSRASRRHGRRTLGDLRAIPWVFSWNQSRHYLPGWFGIGSALEKLSDEEPANYARFMELARSSSFLRYVLTNIEGNIASADLDLMREYSALVDDEKVRDEIYGIIATDLERALAHLGALLIPPMDKRRPRLKHTLGLRAEGLKKLHRLQIRQLRHWREVKDKNRQEADTALAGLLLCVNAIANGLRTTG